MEERTVYTIKTLLEELKKTIPRFKKGQFFETLKSIYPDTDIPKNEKNISIDGISFTRPMASSRKDKRNYVKEHSPISKFFTDLKRGDILEILETNGYTAICRNVSLNEIAKEYYKDEKIELTFNMIAEGFIKQVRKIKRLEEQINGT